MCALNQFIHDREYSRYYTIKPITGVKETFELIKEFDNFAFYRIKQLKIKLGYAVKLDNPDNFLLLKNCIIQSNGDLSKDFYKDSDDIYTIIKDINNTLILFEKRITLKELKNGID